MQLKTSQNKLKCIVVSHIVIIQYISLSIISHSKFATYIKYQSAFGKLVACSLPKNEL